MTEALPPAPDLKLSPAVRAFLEEPRFAVVASIGPDGMPHQTVMWYRLDGDQILLNQGRKRTRARHLRHDPRLSFCVEDGARYVTITGRTELRTDQEQAVNDIVSLAIRYEGEEDGKATRAFFEKEKRETIILRIEAVDARGF
jgi:PPOX class probable F420-dependent enzyme